MGTGLEGCGCVSVGCAAMFNCPTGPLPVATSSVLHIVPMLLRASRRAGSRTTRSWQARHPPTSTPAQRW